MTVGNVGLDLSALAEISSIASESAKTNTVKNTQGDKKTDTSQSENDYVAFDFSDDDELSDVQQLQREHILELEKYYMYQYRIIQLKSEQQQLSRRIELAEDKDSQSVSNMQSRIKEIDTSISNYTNLSTECSNNLAKLEAKINEGLAMQLQSANSGVTSGVSSPAGMQTQGGGGSTATVSTIPQELANGLDSKLGSGFSAKCEQVAAQIGCNPNDLLAMMYSESGLNPQATNPNGGAAGLIQFMPSTLSANGYSSAQVKSMSAVQQLDVVADIMLKSKAMSGYGQGDKIDAGTLYALCFLPAAAKNEVLCSQGGNLSWAYSANSALDRDHNGSISKSDLGQRLGAKYNEMRGAFG